MKKPTTAQVMAYFKKADRMILAEHDGQMWVTDSYLLIPVDEKSVVAQLLAEYNLPFEPMVCDVRRTVVRRKNDRVPDVGSVIPDAKALKSLAAIKRETLAGQDAFGMLQGELTRIYSNRLELPVVLNDARATMAEHFTPDAAWMTGPDPLKAVARVRGKAAIGLLMPCRADHAALRKSVAA